MLATSLCYFNISASFIHASHTCLPPPELLGITDCKHIFYTTLHIFFPLRANHEPEFGACLGFFLPSGSIIPNLCSINSSICPFFIMAIYQPSWRSKVHFFSFRLNFDITLIFITVSFIFGLKIDINFSKLFN